MVDLTVNEKIDVLKKEMDNPDKIWTRRELLEIKTDIQSDIKFADYKRQFWNDLGAQLRQLRARVNVLYNGLEKTCEICGQEPQGKEVLRTLPKPDGRRVCKKCWRENIVEARMKNFNNAMKS